MVVHISETTKAALDETENLFALEESKPVHFSVSPPATTTTTMGQETQTFGTYNVVGKNGPIRQPPPQVALSL